MSSPSQCSGAQGAKKAGGSRRAEAALDERRLTSDDTSLPSLSKRQPQRSAKSFRSSRRRSGLRWWLGEATNSQPLPVVLAGGRVGHQDVVWRAKLRAQLRSLLWRAWARYRPIFGGVALGYTSLREQHVYNCAAKLYAAAFTLDPGRSGRPLAAWFRRAVPMETDSRSVGSQPPKRAKKSRMS